MGLELETSAAHSTVVEQQVDVGKVFLLSYSHHMRLIKSTDTNTFPGVVISWKMTGGK